MGTQPAGGGEGGRWGLRSGGAGAGLPLAGQTTLCHHRFPAHTGPALLGSAPRPGAPVRGHAPSGRVAPPLPRPAGVLGAQQAPAALAGRLWQSPGATANAFGIRTVSSTPPTVHHVLTRRLGARVLHGAADGQSGAGGAALSLAGTLPGGGCRQRRGRGPASSPRTGAGGSMRSQRRAHVFPRATARGVARHGPGQPLFSSGLWEFPPLPPLTPHAGEVPSFVWQRCPAPFAALLPLAPARALPARLQLPPSHDQAITSHDMRRPRLLWSRLLPPAPEPGHGQQPQPCPKSPTAGGSLGGPWGGKLRGAGGEVHREVICTGPGSRAICSCSSCVLGDAQDSLQLTSPGSRAASGACSQGW